MFKMSNAIMKEFITFSSKSLSLEMNFVFDKIKIKNFSNPIIIKTNLIP